MLLYSTIYASNEFPNLYGNPKNNLYLGCTAFNEDNLLTSRDTIL